MLHCIKSKITYILTPLPCVAGQPAAGGDLRRGGGAVPRGGGRRHAPHGQAPRVRQRAPQAQAGHRLRGHQGDRTMRWCVCTL